MQTFIPLSSWLVEGTWSFKVVTRKYAGLVHLWIFTRGQRLLEITHTFYLSVSQIGLILSVTTTLQLHFPSTPPVTKLIISPSSHFYNNNFSIAHQLSFSYPLVWFIYKIALVQFYRYGKHTALLNSTWRVPLCFDLFLPLKKVLTFWFLLMLLKKCSENVNSQKRTFRGCIYTSKN